MNINAIMINKALGFLAVAKAIYFQVCGCNENSDH
jgi:hypothetical protein